MIYAFLLLLFSCAQPLELPPDFTDEQINRVMATLKEKGAFAAEESIKKFDTSAYDFCMSIAGSDRRDEAIQLLNALTLVYEGEMEQRYFYGRSWVLFMDGRLDESMKGISLLLSHPLEKRIRARSLYLAGNIHLRWHKYRLALQHIESAEKIYTELGARGGIFLTTLRRADIALRTGDLDKGYELIDEARFLNSQLAVKYNESYINDVLGNYHIQEGNLEAAKQLTEEALEEYQTSEKEHSTIWMMIRKGHLLALSGDINGAYKTAYEVDRLIEKNGKLVREAHYNNLTWILLHRCSDFDYESMKLKMQAWAKSNNGGVELLKLLNRMETANCL